MAKSSSAAADARETGPYAWTALLGVRAANLNDLLRAIRRGLPFEAIERLHRAAHLDVDDIAELVQIPRRTMTRRRQDGRFLPEESDRLVSAARLLAKAIDLFEGNADAARQWLLAPQIALGGAVPLELARAEVGAREVETLIDRLEQGVFS